MKRYCVLLLSILHICGLHGQQTVIDSLTPIPAHPRLLMKEADVQRIRQSIQTDEHWKAIQKAILQQCDSLLLLPPSERIMGGIRLDPNRLCGYRIFYLSYAWRTTHEKKYFEQAKKELLAVCHFSDWNPSHYLDVAELTMAVAIGYDWLYNELKTPERRIMQQAIRTKGILTSYDTSYHAYRKWLSVTNNWNQVCNTSISYGAMAIYENDPAFARKVIDRSLKSIVISMKDYDPDGAYAEGYGYWSYGTTYNVLFIEGLTTMFGRDFGLTQQTGFMKSAGYLENMIGPTGQNFNYSDVRATSTLQPAMFWFAKKLNDPSLLWEERRLMSGDALKQQLSYRFLPATLIWGAGITIDALPTPNEKSWVGAGRVPVALMRSSWSNPAAVYAAIKGGSPSVTHGHMDAGAFVVEADGIRWAMDFGYQDYASLESRNIDLWDDKQDGQRWKIFRYNNFTHNTLTVNDGLQQVKGYAFITHTSKQPGSLSAVVDMTALYNGKNALTKADRGIALLDDRYVLVRDEITTGDSAVTIRWSMLTPAGVTITAPASAPGTGPGTALLTSEGKTLQLTATGTVPLQMQTWATDPPPQDYDSPNPGTVIVGFIAHVPPNTKASFNVYLVPGSTAGTSLKTPKELSAWK